MITTSARLRLRVYLGEDHSLGPGKVQLLEAVRELGSITSAARSMDMAYRHAWELIDDMNRCFRSPVVATASGGATRGGARVTAFGEEVIRRFRAMEQATRTATAADLASLEAEVARTARASPGPAARAARAARRSRRERPRAR
jgi:molybdate transport system regulatory protein